MKDKLMKQPDWTTFIYNLGASGGLLGAATLATHSPPPVDITPMTAAVEKCAAAVQRLEIHEAQMDVSFADFRAEVSRRVEANQQAVVAMNARFLAPAAIVHLVETESSVLKRVLENQNKVATHEEISELRQDIKEVRAVLNGFGRSAKSGP